MFVVRESSPADFAQILEIARHLNSYNLPYDEVAIRKILEVSGQSFAGTLPIVDRAFTFVVENIETKQVVGTSMLYSQHGTHSSPHVYLDVLQEERYSETLQRYMRQRALRIGYNYDGPTEIGGLILLPEYRGHTESLGKLLSYARFLFIAMNPSFFRDTILSELLPRLESDGTSRMWKHFGKRFTGLSYRDADRMSKDNKEFIKSLFPQGIIYTSMFPEEVQDEIGEVGPQTKGVERMLKKIGFQYAQQIDPFDGGPHFVAKTKDVSVIANARSYTSGPLPQGTAGSRTLIARTHDGEQGFRCCWADAVIDTDAILIPTERAGALEIEVGDPLWAVQP